MIMAEVPEALAKEPLSPVLASQFETMVPSGKAFTGKMFPTDRAAILHMNTITKLLTLGTGIDKLTGVEAFDSNEVFISVLELVWVSENNLGEGGSSTRVVNDFLDNTLDVSINALK